MKKNHFMLISFSAIIIFFIILVSIMLYYVNISSVNKLKICNAELDISQWDYNNSSIIPLSGDWGFNWFKFIKNDDINNINADIVEYAPRVWNNYKINGENLTGFGYGTYRLKVTGAKINTPLSLYVPSFSTSYQLYIDDKLEAENGITSDTSYIYKPEYNPQRVVFNPQKSEFNIIIHVSNFTYARGGMWYTLFLGTVSQINAIEKAIICRDMFLLGSYFVMSVFFLAIFFLRKSEKSNFYFVIMCLFAALRTMMYGCYSINFLLPLINFDTIIKLNYITLLWFPSVVLFSIFEMFKNVLNQTLQKAALIYSITITLFVILSPTYIFTQFVLSIYAVLIIISCYDIYVLFKVVFLNKVEAVFILAGGLALLMCVIYDMAYQQNYISGGFFELSPIGFLILLLMFSVILAKRFTMTIVEKEDALVELKQSNVRERKAELKFLKSQISQHFIHNVINTIISVSRYDVDNSRDLLIEFSNYLRGCFDFRDLDDLVSVSNELAHVKSYLILEQARFGDRLRVEYDIDSDNYMIPPMILQPIVENAIKHGIRTKPNGGTVLIYVKSYKEHFKIGVKDDGNGIDKDKINLILTGKTERGVGLNNINQRLNNLFGEQLHIENVESGGIDVYIKLPINNSINVNVEI